MHNGLYSFIFLLFPFELSVSYFPFCHVPLESFNLEAQKRRNKHISEQNLIMVTLCYLHNFCTKCKPSNCQYLIQVFKSGEEAPGHTEKLRNNFKKTRAVVFCIFLISILDAGVSPLEISSVWSKENF